MCKLNKGWYMCASKTRDGICVQVKQGMVCASKTRDGMCK